MLTVFEPTPDGTCGIRRDMICTCKEEGERAAVALRLEVQRRLGVCPADAWTAAILSMAWDFGCDLSVMADMWCGVSAVAADGTSAYVECDWPFDGVFALWKEAADRSPERVTAIGPHVNFDETRVRAETLLKEYAALHSDSLAHDYACPSCAVGHVDRVRINAPSQRCEEGEILWNAFFPPLHALSDIWAVPSCDDAPFSWGY